MATLVLTALGTAIGGPIGGAIGAFLGQQVDQAVLGSMRTVEGPRLKELQLQTSSYGTQIPAILGKMRVAGTVIWATDIMESRSKSGGGKGRPSTVNYNYSANFAVALSSRPIARIGRIWADGNLMRGSAGDFKVGTEFRFYLGYDDQPVDPLIASAVGTALCPAYRGLAYAVFEGLQLADYGNRIPSLTFELFERDGTVSVATIANIGSGNIIAGDSAVNLDGYALQSADAKSALDPLLSFVPVLARTQGDHLELLDWFAPQSAPQESVKIAHVNGKAVESPEITRRPSQEIPAQFSVRYFDPVRDYQAGMQNSRRNFGKGNTTQIDFPATLTTEMAYRFADLALLQIERSRQQCAFFCVDGDAVLRPGHRVIVRDSDFRVIEVERFLGFQHIRAQSWIDADPFASAPTDAGMPVIQPDIEIGVTKLMLLDLPALTAVEPLTAQIFAVATGTSAGWRGARLAYRDADRLVDLGPTARPAVMGTLESPLAIQASTVIDFNSHPIVRLWNNNLVLPVGTGDPTSVDAPTLWIDGEIIRYGTAEYLGGSDYRLDTLIRGLAGSDEYMTLHQSGSSVVLLEQASLRAIDDFAVTTGSDMIVEAQGLADVEPVAATLRVTANALRPLAPVHLTANQRSDGSLLLQWVRRSRVDYGWRDFVDMPQVEGSLRFEVRLKLDNVERARWQTQTESLNLTSAELASIAPLGAVTAVFEIREIGRHSPSEPAAMSINL